MALSATGPIWQRLDEMIDRAPSPAGLHFHRLGAPAAYRLRERGLVVPPELREEEEIGLMAAATVPTVLSRLVEILADPPLIMKGPVLAAHYPEPHLRAYLDLDVIVADAADGQARLMAAGAQYATDEEAPADGHHQRELMLPPLPFSIELHTFPSWPATGRPPHADELLEIACPAPELGPGVLKLPVSEHAVVVAAHSWGHRPLRRLRDLLDVAVLMADGDADRERAEAAAERWGVPKIWQTTVAATDALFGAGPTPMALRTWARDLSRTRRRSLGETALEHAVAGFWVTAPGPAGRAGIRRLGQAIGERTRPGSRDGNK